MSGAFVLAAALAIPQVRYSPPRPTVGDVVRVELPGVTGPVSAVSSECAEVIGTGGGSFRVRSFRPGDCTLHFTLTEGAEKQRLITSVRIHSVIPPDDELQPAPVRPPQPLPPNRTAFTALGIAAALAAIAWAAAVIRKRRADRAITAPAEIWVDPYEQFREAIARVGDATDCRAAAELADATRNFLARIDPRFSRDLTTRELLRALGGSGVAERVVIAAREVLRRGDVAKFAPGEGGFESEGRTASTEILQAFTPAKEEAS